MTDNPFRKNEPQTRQRSGFTIGTGRTSPPRPTTPPPTTTTTTTTGSGGSESEDVSLVLSEEEVDWGTLLGGELGLKITEQPQTPPPVTRTRRGGGDSRPLVMGLMAYNPTILKNLAPLKAAKTYQQLQPEDRASMFDMLVGDPDKLGQMIEKSPEVRDDLVQRMLAKNDDRLVSQCFDAMGGSSSDTINLVKGMIVKAGDRRAGLLKLAVQCAGDTIDDASDAGTAGRSNTGRSAFISQMGKSGQSKESIDNGVAGTKESLKTMRPPQGASMKPEDFSGKSQSEAGVIIQQTVKLVAQVMEKLLADLNATAITPELSMITAALYSKAGSRFNEVEARRQAGGHIFLRVIIPAVVPGLMGGATPDQQRILTLATKGLQSVANGVGFDAKEKYMALLNPWFAKVKQALDKFIDQVVKSGKVYADLLAASGDLDPTDPSDIVSAAQNDPKLAAKLFADPDKDYPFGTRPAETCSPLGKLLEEAAHGRDRDTDFEETRKLRGFPELVRDERREVLDAVRL